MRTMQWLSVSMDIDEHFSQKCDSEETPWFVPRDSEILRKWCFEGVSDCAGNEHIPDDVSGDVIECSCGARGLSAGFGYLCGGCGKHKWLRQAAICRDCSLEISNPSTKIRRRDYAVDPLHEACESGQYQSILTVAELDRAEGQSAPPQTILGKAIHRIAPELAALTDFEEMVISLVHPLVQVYTIPRTGELAYVGHVCNFRQDVKKFMDKLPVMPKDMPTVFVRPRASAGNLDRIKRKSFAVNMDRLRAAYAWLQEHNPYYKSIEWDESAAAAWDGEPDIQCRDEIIDAHVDVDKSCFCKWIAAGRQALESGSSGFARSRDFSALPSMQEACAASDDDASAVWFWNGQTYKCLL